MAITDLASAPSPPLLARLWQRIADLAAPNRIDWAIAGICFAGFTVPVLVGAGPAGQPGLAAAFGAVAAAPLIARRRWPVAVVLVVAAVYVAAALTGVSFTPFVSNAGPNLAIAVFTMADQCPRRRSLTSALVVAIATWTMLLPAIHLHPHTDQDAVQFFATIGAWLAGDVVRSLRGYRQQLQLLQARHAAEEVQLALAEERLRLSREVHDVVSHSLSSIAVQAGAARLVFAGQPAPAGAALAAIETASRSALDELRKLLRQIREPRDADEVATPALSDLPALVDKLSKAGLDVIYHSTGQPRRYSTALELSAYRIAQEALTNVTRHASGARVRVEVGHGPDELVVTVTDAGSPHPTGPGTGDGLGIRGMHERAGLFGGTLTACPTPDGGYMVSARLPVQALHDQTGAGA